MLAPFPPFYLTQQWWTSLVILMYNMQPTRALCHLPVAWRVSTSSTAP
jgi:hypothetical protein